MSKRHDTAPEHVREYAVFADLLEDEQQWWADGNRVAAIKSVRARTGLGLAEARALCELLGGGE